MRLSFLSRAASLTVLAGCGTQIIETGPVVVPYAATADSAQYAPYSKPGTATIAGGLFLKTRGGDVKIGAGETVLLAPATPLAREWYDRVLGWARSPAPPRDSLFAKHLKSTTADAQGKFRFVNLPAGTYLLLGRVVWEVPTLGVQGGYIGQEVKVADGEQREVVLTR